MGSTMTPTQQIARVAHPSTSRKRLLAMIAYFDESGKPEDRPIVSLAAVVALDIKWFRFDVKWKRLLATNKAAIHPAENVRWFHMTDFSKRAAPYNEWSEQKRISFSASLARATKDAIVFGTCHSILVKDWNEVILPSLENSYKKKRGWYIFLLHAVLLDIANFVKVPRYERIACVFDENKEVSYAAKMHYEGLKQARGLQNTFGSSTYDRSPLIPGLQAADMLAFEGRRAVENKTLNNNLEPIRKLFENLTNRKQITVGRTTREDLIKFHNDWMRVRAYREAMEAGHDDELM
jgi:hypothetical protein